MNRLNKEINTISLLKHLATEKVEGDVNQVKILPPDYKPLLKSFDNSDFKNQLLIPIVLNKKKIYLEGESLMTADEYNSNSNATKDYYKDLQNFGEQFQGTKHFANYDTHINLLMNEVNPNQISENQELGLLFRLGEGMDEQDTHKTFQDTLTIRHCNSNYKCQSFPLVTEFDYQVSLGPIGRYMNSEEYESNKKEMLEDDEDKTTDILEIKGKQKVIYQGDILNVVGFLRPPINYLSHRNNLNLIDDKNLENDLQNNRISPDGENTNLNNLYNDRSDKNQIKTIQLDEADEDFNIFEDPESFVYYVSNTAINKETLRSGFNNILPNIEQILKVYKKFSSVEDIYNILSNFNYSKITLTHQDADIIHSLSKKYLKKMEKFNESMSKKYDKHQIQREQEEEQRKKELENHDVNKDVPNVNFIVNNIFEDIEKLYYNDYQYHNTLLDSDVLRLNWLYRQDDNGLYLFMYLLLDYFKNQLDHNDIEKLEDTLKVIKEKYQAVELRKPSEQVTESLAKQITKCQDRKVNQPKIIKYPSVERMMEDNQKVIVDSDGEVVSSGD